MHVQTMYMYNVSGSLCIFQGTLIRVYDTSTQAQLLELRRGAASANIFW